MTRAPELCDQAWHSALDGTLTAHAAAHVAACAECTRKLRAVRSAIKVVEGGIPRLPDALDERLLRAIRQSSRASSEP